MKIKQLDSLNISIFAYLFHTLIDVVDKEKNSVTEYIDRYFPTNLLFKSAI